MLQMIKFSDTEIHTTIMSINSQLEYYNRFTDLQFAEYIWKYDTTGDVMYEWWHEDDKTHKIDIKTVVNQIIPNLEIELKLAKLELEGLR